MVENHVAVLQHLANCVMIRMTRDDQDDEIADIIAQHGLKAAVHGPFLVREERDLYAVADDVRAWVVAREGLYDECENLLVCLACVEQPWAIRDLKSSAASSLYLAPFLSLPWSYRTSHTIVDLRVNKFECMIDCTVVTQGSCYWVVAFRP